MVTWQDVAPYTVSPDWNDTTRNISDPELGRAIADTGNLLNAAVALTEHYGHIVARADIAARVDASPVLQHVLEVARAAYMQHALANGYRAIAEREQERQSVVQEWRRLHEERMSACELHRARNHGPRCGAKTRAGRPCQRKVVLGKTRCPNHGGLSTGPKSPEGKARSLAALRRRASPR